MLGNSDRLRILCRVLNVEEEEFLRRFTEERRATVKGANLPRDDRESVRSWWAHRHQPIKSPAIITAALQRKADEMRKSWDVAQLWEAQLSPGQFTEAVGTTVYEVADVLSPLCRRSVFEETDRLPFLRLMREEREAHPATGTARGKMHGTYTLVRTHSFESVLCQEFFSIETRAAELVAGGRYRQYAGEGRERIIDLSLLISARWMHVIGAYRQRDDAGAVSMVHATILCDAVHGEYFAGIMHDVTDNQLGLAGQRILLKKINQSILPEMRPVVVDRDHPLDAVLARYATFLRDEEQEDPFLLNVDVHRLKRILDSR